MVLSPLQGQTEQASTPSAQDVGSINKEVAIQCFSGNSGFSSDSCGFSGQQNIVYQPKFITAFPLNLRTCITEDILCFDSNNDDEMNPADFKVEILKVMGNYLAVLGVLNRIQDPTYYHVPLDLFGNTILHYLCVLGYDGVLETIIKRFCINSPLFEVRNRVGITPFDLSSMTKNKGPQYRRIFDFLHVRSIQDCFSCPMSPREELLFSHNTVQEQIPEPTSMRYKDEVLVVVQAVTQPMENTHQETIPPQKLARNGRKISFKLENEEIGERDFKRGILRAVDSSNHAEILKILKNVHDPRYYGLRLDIFGNTILHYACVLEFDYIILAIIRDVCITSPLLRVPNDAGITPFNIAFAEQDYGWGYRRILQYLSDK